MAQTRLHIEPLEPPPTSGLHIEPLEQPQQPEPTWGQSIISNILGTGPAIIGGVGGALAGGPVGGALGGMAGGGLGSHWRQQYEISQGLRPEYNPYLTALDVGLGALPGITKAPASMALKELGKYGLKTAAESAVIGGVSAPAYAKAETGEWDISPRNILQSAAVGGVTGGVLGPAVHVGVNRLPVRAIPPATEEAAAQTRPPEFQTPQVEESPPVVSARGMSAAELSMWQNKGYKPIGPDAQGYPQLGRPDVAPLYRAPSAAEPTAPIVPEESPFGPDRVIPGDEVPVPTERANLSYIEEMRKGGYVVDRTDATTTYFKKVDEGTIDEEPFVSKMALPPEDVRTNLTRMMGREPTPEELDRSMSRQAGLGEQTGRVARFDPTDPDAPWHLLGAEGELPGYEAQQAGNKFYARHPALDRPQGPFDSIADVYDWAESHQRDIGTGQEPGVAEQAWMDEPQYARAPEVSTLDAIDQLRERMRLNQIDEMNRRIDAGEPIQETPFQTGWRKLTPEGQRAVSQATIADPFNIEAGLQQPELPPDFEPPARMQVRAGGYGGGGRVTVNPQTGRPNLAMGGADPQVIRQLGQSLYTRDRPSVLIQELFQNTIDEMKIAGIQEPVRVAFVNNSKNPATGADQKSVVFQDFGRGMNESQLYNEFSDVGKSGKRHIQGAAGGFGFAKAAPFLGGEYMRVESITMEGGEKVRYTFEGNPEQFVDQQNGVPLNREVLDDPYDMNYDKPTGMRVEVFFGRDRYFNNAQELLKLVSEGSAGVSNIEAYQDYSGLDDTLDPNSRVSKFIRTGEQGLPSYDRSNNFNRYGTQPPPSHVADITTPSNDTSVRFDLDNKERAGITLVYLNNGTFYHTERYGVGLNPLPHIPQKIVFDIKSKVPEGHTDYPFPANREGINQNVKNELRRWIEDNVVKPAKNMYRGEIQQVYNNLRPVGYNRHVVLDSGAKYTPEELARVQQSPVLRKMADSMEELLDELASHFQPNEVRGTTGKFGYRIADEGQGGINISDPSTSGSNAKYAILVNPFDAFRSGFSGAMGNLTPQQAARRFVHLVKHEFTHNLARDEGAGFTWAFSQVDTRFPRTDAYVAQILKTITGPTGSYVAEVPNLIREYTAARGRPESQVDILSRQAESPFLARAGQGGIPGGNQPTGAGTPPTGPRRQQPESLTRQILHAPRGLMATWDFSAPMRQALPMIGTKAWWTSWAPMFSSWMKEGNYQAIINEIKSRPEFRRPFDPATGRFGKSLADEAGLRLTDINGDLTTREENTIGGLLEKLPGVRRSNRAYTAYLNSLRADSFRALLDDAEKIGMRPRRDLVLSRNIAEFVNNASGRGSLGRFEQNAKLMADVFFSPRLLASRVNMLNPATYLQAPPFVRKQYLKAFLSTVGAWGTIAGLASMAGADVSTDPESADFGKIRIGNTRIDPAGGFQQYMVAAWRLLSGSTKTSGKRYETGSGFPAPTRLDIAQNFLSNKLNPVANFVYDIANATKQRPAYGGDRMLQMFIPMIAGDLYELWRKGEYDLMPLVGATTAVGMGTATYERGKEESVFIPQRSDPWKMEGGQIPFVSDVMQDIRRTVD